LYHGGDPLLDGLLRAYGDYVMREVLAEEARAGAIPDGAGVYRKTLRLDTRDVSLAIARGGAPRP